MLQANLPDIEIPANTREGILPRKDMILLNMRLSALPLALAVCCALYCIVISIIILCEGRELSHIEPFRYATVILVVLFFYSFIACATLFPTIFRMKMYATPLTYGYTKDILYGASAYHQGVNRWEYYSRWKETGKHFLLLAEARWAPPQIHVDPGGIKRTPDHHAC